MSDICIQTISEIQSTRKEWNQTRKSGPNVKYVTPGEEITSDQTFMRGHGTYLKGESQLIASIAGIVEPINRLVSVRPLRTRYNGEIGDVIVGRITEVMQKRWKVDTNSRMDSVLQLNGVNLPGGELRRKTIEDEMMMREYLKEGDLISAEVQNVFEDGALGLHTRSLKYGKLGQGLLVRVSPSLIERRKTHFHKLPMGVNIILGNNGFIWISQTVAEGAESGGFLIDTNAVPLSERVKIATIRNCILALAQHKVMLHDTSILFSYEICEQLAYPPKDLLKPKCIDEIANLTKEKLCEIQI